MVKDLYLRKFTQFQLYVGIKKPEGFHTNLVTSVLFILMLCYYRMESTVF